MDLPTEPSESRSSSEASGSQSKYFVAKDAIATAYTDRIFVIENSDKQQIIHIISCEKTPQPTPSLSNTNNTEQPNTTIVPGDNYSYVQLTAVHEYNYPVVDEPVGAVMNARRGSTCSLKKRSALDMAEQHIIKEPSLHKSRMRCRYECGIILLKLYSVC